MWRRARESTEKVNNRRRRAGNEMEKMDFSDRDYRGEKNPNRKLTREKVMEIRRLCAEGVMVKDVAARFGVSSSSISDIRHGKAWGTV